MRYLLAPLLFLGCGEEQLSQLEVFLAENKPTSQEQIGKVEPYEFQDTYTVKINDNELKGEEISLTHFQGESQWLNNDGVFPKELCLLTVTGRKGARLHKFENPDCNKRITRGTLTSKGRAFGYQSLTEEGREEVLANYSKWEDMLFANYQAPE